MLEKTKIMAKKELHLQDHQQLSFRLLTVRKDVCGLLTGSTGLSVKEAEKLQKIVSKIDIFRSDMENRLFREHPNEANIRVYYPSDRKIAIAEMVPFKLAKD